ncbi:hypothetical protein V9T40_007484 [Parthenolecanium corni]|uniref:Uncharacterized protein n=1 Tax=Parthenolecanium corni TaxID=536013 RepID=A0AAN9TLD9_9HEMI
MRCSPISLFDYKCVASFAIAAATAAAAAAASSAQLLPRIAALFRSATRRVACVRCDAMRYATLIILASLEAATSAAALGPIRIAASPVHSVHRPPSTVYVASCGEGDILARWPRGVCSRPPRRKKTRRIEPLCAEAQQPASLNLSYTYCRRSRSRSRSSWSAAATRRQLGLFELNTPRRDETRRDETVGHEIWPKMYSRRNFTIN